MNKITYIGSVTFLAMYLASMGVIAYKVVSVNHLLDEEPLPNCTHMIDVSMQIPLCDGVNNVLGTR